LIDLKNLTIKDMMLIALSEIDKYEDSEDKKHLTNAKDVLTGVTMAYDCERIDGKNFVFFEKNIFVINTPLYNDDIGDKHESRNNT